MLIAGSELRVSGCWVGGGPESPGRFRVLRIHGELEIELDGRNSG